MRGWEDETSWTQKPLKSDSSSDCWWERSCVDAAPSAPAAAAHLQTSAEAAAGLPSSPVWASRSTRGGDLQPRPGLLPWSDIPTEAQLQAAEAPCRQPSTYREVGCVEEAERGSPPSPSGP